MMEEVPTIRDWIISFGSDPLVSSISSLCGIVGLIFSIVIWAKTKDLKEQINFYKRNQKTIVTRLISYRDSISKDELYTLNIRSSIRTELYGLLQGYGSLFSLWVKVKIYWTIHLLNAKKTDPDIEKLCALLDWIIARIQRKETRKWPPKSLLLL